MNIFQRFNNWRTKKRLNRLEADLQMIRNKINFDPRYAFELTDLNTSEAYTRRLEEYRVWYTGNSRQLRYLYYKSIKADSLNYFWFKAPITHRMLHSGIPGLISTKMATILFGGGYDVDVTVYKDGATDKNTEDAKDENKSKQAKELLMNLITILDINERFENGAENESWGGHIFGKFSHKVSLSNYPIFEIVNINKAEAIKERGITTAIIFKYWYDDKQKHYRLDEIYTTNEDGDAVIRYELYLLKADGNEELVDLDTIPEGQSLMFADDGTPKLNENNEFIYKGIKGMLAFDKPNKTPSHEFPNSFYGASDYEGAIDSFDALDEAYTELINEIRDNRTIRYIPETMVPTRTVLDKDGKEIQVDEDLNDFVTNYITVAGDLDQNAQNEIKIQQIADKTEDNKKKFLVALSQACAKAGIALVSLGIPGFESIDASAESQQERNKATLETRKKKLKLWNPFIKDVFMKMLELNSWMQQNTSASQDAFAKLDLNFDNLDVDITFGDYIDNKQEDLLTAWGLAKQSGIASVEMAVDKIHPDLNDAKKLEEVQRIKFENNISMDSPETLQINDLLNNNDEPEDENDGDNAA